MARLFESRGAVGNDFGRGRGAGRRAIGPPRPRLPPRARVRVRRAPRHRRRRRRRTVGLRFLSRLRAHQYNTHHAATVSARTTQHPAARHDHCNRVLTSYIASDTISYLRVFSPAFVSEPDVRYCRISLLYNTRRTYTLPKVHVLPWHIRANRTNVSSSRRFVLHKTFDTRWSSGPLSQSATWRRTATATTKWCRPPRRCRRTTGPTSSCSSDVTRRPSRHSVWRSTGRSTGRWRTRPRPFPRPSTTPSTPYSASSAAKTITRTKSLEASIP